MATVWQHPLVDVFKLVSAGTFSISQRGDVSECLDKTIRRRCVERSLHQIMFVYVQVRRERGESITFHLDILTRKKTSLRISCSTMYSNYRSVSTNLRVPLLLGEKWCVIALDMLQLLKLHTSVAYNREGYDCLK
ncbi:hypothetical protein THRCLA_05256, partial [Thraustotheca clavata]